MYKSKFRDETIYHYAELKVWEKTFDNIRTLGGPPSFDRSTNPVIVNDRVIGTSFSPGRIICLHKKTGKICWQRKLSYFGSPGSVYDGRYYGGTSQELFCLNPNTGKIIWSFRVKYGSGEYIYSRPEFSDGRLYIGDREGFLYCLRASTGELLWKSSTGNGQMNATPLVLKNAVYAPNTCRRLSAFNKNSGEQLWVKNTKSSSIYKPICYSGRILVHDTDHPVLSISPQGKDPRPRSFKTHRIASIACAKESLFMIDNKKHQGDPKGKTRFLEFKGSKLVKEIPIESSCQELMYVAEEKAIVITHFFGLYIYSIPKKKILAYISWAHGEFPMPPLPAYENGFLYLAKHENSLMKLKFPKV